MQTKYKSFSDNTAYPVANLGWPIICITTNKRNISRLISGGELFQDDESEIIRSGASDIGSLLVYSDDEDGAGSRGRRQDKAPIVTPTVDGTPTHQRHPTQLDASASRTGGHDGQGQHFDHNGDVPGRHRAGGHGGSGNIYEPTESPLCEHPGIF